MKDYGWALIAAFCGGLAVSAGAAFGAVEMGQTIRLEKGWNAVHVEVGETNDVYALHDPAAATSMVVSPAGTEYGRSSPYHGITTIPVIFGGVAIMLSAIFCSAVPLACIALLI